MDIYFIAIGGTGMAPLACLLKERGHRVRGSDGPLYPPMSTLLEAAGVEPLVGWDPAHLEPSPDLVIVGNAVRRDNPEAVEVERRGIERISMPQALGRFFLDRRRPLVVSGTHGKTTTTSIAAWVYSQCGADPGYLIGGIPRNFDRSFHIGGGERFIIEGDEYNAAYFDRGPKFLHYRPQTVLLTSVEYDHADLYPDPETVLEAYRRLMALVPEDGLVVACGDSQGVREVASEARCRVVFYGLGPANEVHPRRVESGPEGCRFTVSDARRGDVELALSVAGEHNLQNALAVWTAARHDRLEAAAAAAALASFRGVQRRLEELGTVRGVTVVDDFAHHPTAVEKSLGGLRQRYPGRRVVALFEPRSLTAGRAFFFDAYLQAFLHADAVLLAPIFHRRRLAADERLDTAILARRLREMGVRATACASVDEVLARAVEGAAEGDVLVTMSSGAFEGLPRRLLKALQLSTPSPPGGATALPPSPPGGARTVRPYRDELVRRVGRLHGFAQAALVVVVAGYWLVQVAEGSAYRELAENNRLRKLSIEAPRGLIRDRHGRPLVENVPSYSLLIDRSRSRDLEASLAFAARILERPAAELRGILAGHRQTPSFKPVQLAGELSLQQVARFGVEHFEHPEFEIAVSHLRLYRHAHQTAHILGYLGEATEAELSRPGSSYRAGDTVGKKGIEGLYESHLRGQRGEQVVVVDSRGRLIEEYDRHAAAPGRELTLTIDLALQQEAANQLAGKVGAIIALDPRQGEVLAMVSAPSFNPNRFARRLRPEEWRELVDDPHHPLQNRAVQNAYPPGSTFKIVMALAGLDLGLIDPQAFPVSCRGFSTIYNNRYRCWKSSGHGPVDLKRSLKHSCNVYYHQLGQRLGIDQIAAYSRMLGLGRATGIDLAGERAGLIPDSRWSLEHRGAPWYPGETISVATGQGPILVTPLQLAVVMAAIANGGELVTPHLVRREDGPAHRAVRPSQTRLAGSPETAERLSREHLELVREALWSVVNEPRGTGRSAEVEGLDIAGKTGTAQVVSQESRTKSEDLPPELRDHAWFVSFAPVADPRLVVVVFVEHGGSGSRAAAPLARGLYERFFRG